MKRIAVLGSTGSIGLSTLDVARRLPDLCRVVGLGARSDAETLQTQIAEFRPTRAALADPSAFDRLHGAIGSGDTRLFKGPEGLVELAKADDVDVVLSAITGYAGLEPGLAALRAGKTLALANKESLVAAGPLMLYAARDGGGAIIPVDSEHSAIFQAMASGRREEVRRVIITASGGPFRSATLREMEEATPAQALRHPTWNMGPKISIDSATMMNKALEMIEARWLFALEPDQIEVLVHPQSIIHSLVEFRDGSAIAQMGHPDMRVPIQYALLWPDRVASDARMLDLAQVRSLTFEAPDLARFPALELGHRAVRAGGTMGAVLNAANEVAVEAFLAGNLRFTRIAGIVRETMDAHRLVESPTLDDLRAADAWARAEARRLAESPKGNPIHA
ncbi:MAG TPA: 1-deoxy-D-xylulose-5-phosphate reductoisomerase [Planctomycetota bacterium]|nr:1-deoxy-D-xylulose-5-phosphate reductoisomerase [Planctomycetota bacterium]